MVVLQNFVKNENGTYTVLLTFGAKDGVAALPTAQKPLSPENYAVSVDYGVPGAGSVAIDFGSQLTYMYVNGEWSQDSVPPVLEKLTATENQTYTPDEGVDGYDEVVVNVPNATSEIIITQNGTYDAKDGEVGYSKITVNVAAAEEK